WGKASLPLGVPRLVLREMKIRSGNGASALRPHYVDLRVQAREHHGRIGWLRRSALGSPPEDGVTLVMAVHGGPSGTGFSLVARPRHRLLHTKVGAACFLEEVAAQRGAIPYLRRGRARAGFRQSRRLVAHEGVCLYLGERGERADPEGVAVLPDTSQRGDAADVHNPLWGGYAQPQPIQKLRPARDKRR